MLPHRAHLLGLPVWGAVKPRGAFFASAEALAYLMGKLMEGESLNDSSAAAAGIF